ncbi:hypothetical protein N0V88_003142 [Collariella sp. IMI 366227]|nr:hypothetical protein N0V88_003142 [Collariella sp. IMI 366227]
MAFQTSVLRDGVWRTETVDVNTLLKSQQAPAKAPGVSRPAPQRCGLLTSTVVESAHANFILPVRLRSVDNNDVAFVGDRFIQICELREDKQLKEIIRKNDFGCRIRNACVLGTAATPGLSHKDGSTVSQPAVKVEDDPNLVNFPSSAGSTSGSRLPPQLLLVVLETGDNVIFFVRPGIDGRPEFVFSRFGSPRLENGYPGFHLAVDPSSRYLAMAAPAGYFIVSELESHEQLNQAYIRNEPLRLVRSSRLRGVRGVIHKMTFLYPRIEDPRHDGGATGRYGLRANISREIEYEQGMKRAWLLPKEDGYHLLVSLPDSSEALGVSSDFSNPIRLTEADFIPYDLGSTTLALAWSSDLTVQITNNNVILALQGGRSSAWWPCLELQGLLGAEVSDASVRDDCVALSAHTNSQFQIHVYKIDMGSLRLTHVCTFDIDGEVTCLSLDANYKVLAGIRKNSETYLACASPHQTGDGLEMVNLAEPQDKDMNRDDISKNHGLATPSSIEGVASIISIGDEIFLGTRSGEVIILNYKTASISCEKYGNTTATLTFNHSTILVSCGNSLISVALNRHFSSSGGPLHSKTKSWIWPVDVSHLELPSPPVHYATAVDMPTQDGVTAILMISGTSLLLADLHHQPGPVQRSIPVKGIPNRVLYYRPMKCLVVAVTERNRPTLKFIDPDTGEEIIGKPVDKSGEPLDFIVGLGHEGDRILALSPWDYKKDGKVFNYLLIGTKNGWVIVASLQKLGPSDKGGPGIRYWTRHKRDVEKQDADKRGAGKRDVDKKPIYSVIGYDEGLVYCANRTIQWEKLDPREKKLEVFKIAQLNSPASSLRISNGKLIAMTTSDSLVVLDHVSGNESEAGDGLANSEVRHVDPWRRHGVDFISVAGPADPSLQVEEPETSSAAAAPALVAQALAAQAVGAQSLATRTAAAVAAAAPTPTTSSNEIFLVSDRDCGVAGLWVPWQTPDRDTGGCPRRQMTPRSWGASLNGALYQFTLLSVEAWRLLRFIQNLAILGSEKGGVCPFARMQREQIGLDERGPEPRLGGGFEMHVDGDVLKRCVEMRALEGMVERQGQVQRFVALLGEVDGGKYTEGFEEEEGGYERYFALAYDMLEYYLLPAI